MKQLTGNRRYRRENKSRHLESLEPRQLLAGDLVISEFMASNNKTLRDESGIYQDWIEIQNTSLSDVDLSGWYLTDSADELDKWDFPSQLLGPGEFLIVFASGNDVSQAGAELHTNFNLSSDGEYLALTQDHPTAEDPDGMVIATEFSPAYPQQLPDISYGNGLYYETPTPGATNSAGVEGFLIDDVSFSHEHGFYDNPFQLTIESAADGTTIRYTTDGTEPTTSNGTIYSGPISINSTSVIRARSFKAGLDPSNVHTASYMMIDDILTQSSSAPTGWPRSTSISGQTLNYGMDRDIVNSPTWGPQLEEALKQVPSFSIVMDIDDLLGSSRGIYTHASNRGSAWERPISVELIDPLGLQEGFTENAGVRIRGGFSRTGSNPKHSFRLFFREEYGAAKLNYPLFGDEGTNEFDGVDLRTTQNYLWAFQGDSRNAFVRDVYSRDLQRDMGHPYTRSRYYHLYINGTYWGLYQTQERSEASFAASYMGGEPEDYDVIKSSGSAGGYQNEATDGNTQAYRRLANYFYQNNGLSDANM
ncbi:MAG: chitobiase/beta-hexosaminidase C-terminal domain-containing protein, partial [Planctomycetales bacterium]|nr:chitobiase/beta-hexosaminidase C-terminal domain-containing protein [Planctomycetales bacterium]